MLSNNSDNCVCGVNRKAVKAAFVLLPLLGANNILAITGPLSMLPVVYGLWSFASFALTGFQGLLFSLLYCFSNSDVRIYLSYGLVCCSFFAEYLRCFRALEAALYKSDWPYQGVNCL